MRLSSQRPQPDYIGDPSLYGGKLFGSSHPGRFNAVMADGSVRTVSYGVSQPVFKALGGIDDGVPINPDDF
jgi:prepilin-type processing-associated H-X9-DG protein